jgi:hypothetical protein
VAEDAVVVVECLRAHPHCHADDIAAGKEGGDWKVIMETERIPRMTVLVILGAVVLVLAAVVLLFVTERPAGEFEFRGASVDSRFTAETTLELSRTSGSPGTALIVSGRGFSPRETIEIDFATQRLTKVTADGRGSFSGVPVSIPDDWRFKGQVDIVATGESSVRSVAEPFEVN